MVYQWKTGTMYKVEAEVAAKVMNELAAENKLSAKELVEVSRPEEAPLHNEFEWDDTAAAEKWREHQGRKMIGALVTVVENMVQEEPITIRVFHHLEPSKPNYEPIVEIVKHEDRMEMLFKSAMKELAAFKAKYSGIQAFSKLFAVIEELEGKGA